ncbi:MAG TPA: methyltransferase domain-containing protein [Bryobacteraceae bacterium]|jgi:2-polyprenyl-3-methyl-5-hydroxy-6-metoxy-1,4-benzoquinol methylase
MTQEHRDSAYSSSAYILGRTDGERTRLGIQASILNPLTERFLLAVGISPGMRLLDIGSGIGDVALIAARLVGPDGEVVGIDVDPGVVGIASERAREEGVRQVAFECSNIASYNPRRGFDAVLGRHVLIHTPDPLSTVRKAASLLTDGGIAAFEEYDLSFWPAGYPAVTLAANLQWAIVEAFRHVIPHANIGMQVPCLMRQAGLEQVRAQSECLIDAGPDSLFCPWLAETVRSAFPAMEKVGVAAVAGDIETLAPRLREQVKSAGASLTSPLIVRSFGRKARKQD